MALDSEFKVVISDKAWVDYANILNKITEITLFEKSVKKWGILLMNRILSLNFMPNRFAIYEFDKRFRSTHVGKYRIVYYVDEKRNRVIVVRILYARRDLEKVELK